MAQGKDTITPTSQGRKRLRDEEAKKRAAEARKRAQDKVLNAKVAREAAAKKKAAAEAVRLDKEAAKLRERAKAEKAKGSGFEAEYAKGAKEAAAKAAAARKRAGLPATAAKAQSAPLVGQGPLRPGETRKAGSYTGAKPRAAVAPSTGSSPPAGTSAAPAAPTSPGATTAAPFATMAGAGGAVAPGTTASDADIETQARNLYPHMDWALNDAELGPVLRQAATEGWDENRLKGAVFKTNWFKTHGTAKIQSEVRKQADEYLVTLTDDDAKRWAFQIVSGEVQPVEFASWAKEQAKSRFAGLAPAIDRGVTVRQYASQYLADAANTLELPVESLNLREPKWMRALEGQVDPKTGERAPMSRSDWQRTLKTDSIYGYDTTTGARTEASQFVAKLQETFGNR